MILERFFGENDSFCVFVVRKCKRRFLYKDIDRGMSAKIKLSH